MEKTTKAEQKLERANNASSVETLHISMYEFDMNARLNSTSPCYP
jgi:hypothetical protein